MSTVPLTPAWTQLRPHRLQSKLWRTTARFTVVVAGRGSGKTEVSRRKLVRYLDVLKPWLDRNYVYGLPTYSQAKRVAWEQINALIPDSWVSNKQSGRNKSELCITTDSGAKLYVVGLDKPHRIEGIQLDGAVIDECSDQHPNTYTKTILPMLTHRNAWCSRIGVPKRNGVGAAEFKAAFEEGLQPNDKGLESYTWSSSTILSKEQLNDVLAQLTAKDAEEQLGGLWVAGEGQIFYAYSETDSVSETAKYDPNDIIGVGSDFNVNPMAWVLFHVRDGRMYVFDEIYIRNTNTQATLDILYERYGQYHRGGWMFFGDASAQNRHSSTAITDYIQIKNDKRFDEPKAKVIFYPTKNPPVADRFAATNAMLLNGLGVRRLFINPKCKYLRNDLMTRSYKEGTREVDESNKDSGHITDALGYPIHRLFPLRASTPMGQISTAVGINSVPESTVIATVIT